jgi:hypothetical protein
MMIMIIVNESTFKFLCGDCVKDSDSDSAVKIWRILLCSLSTGYSLITVIKLVSLCVLL